MGEKDASFRRMLGDKECFVRFLRRFLRSDMPPVVKAMIDSKDFSLDDIILRLFPEEEMEVLGRHFGVYLQMLAEKEAIDPERIPEDLLKGKGVEEMLTYVEKEMRRCAQEGREEGGMEGREEVAVRLLELGMTISLVSETTKVPEERVRELAGLKG